MTYQSITHRNSPFFAPGNGRKPHSITIHWWDDPARKPTFEGTVDWLCRPGTTASIHYVAEAGRVACLVDPDNIAWHAGDGATGPGNLTSIGIEMNPRQSAGDYATVAELIRDIRKVYGNLPLAGHRQWTSTQCPGTVDLARLDREARGAATPAPAAKPTGNGRHYKIWAPRVPGDFYVKVNRGNTLAGLAKWQGRTLGQVLKLNPQIDNPNVLHVGEIVRLK